MRGMRAWIVSVLFAVTVLRGVVMVGRRIVVTDMTGGQEKKDKKKDDKGGSWDATMGLILEGLAYAAS